MIPTWRSLLEQDNNIDDIDLSFGENPQSNKIVSNLTLKSKDIQTFVSKYDEKLDTTREDKGYSKIKSKAFEEALKDNNKLDDLKSIYVLFSKIKENLSPGSGIASNIVIRNSVDNKNEYLRAIKVISKMASYNPTSKKLEYDFIRDINYFLFKNISAGQFREYDQSGSKALDIMKIKQYAIKEIMQDSSSYVDGFERSANTAIDNFKKLYSNPKEQIETAVKTFIGLFSNKDNINRNKTKVSDLGDLEYNVKILLDHINMPYQTILYIINDNLSLIKAITLAEKKQNPPIEPFDSYFFNQPGGYFESINPFTSICFKYIFRRFIDEFDLDKAYSLILKNNVNIDITENFESFNNDKSKIQEEIIKRIKPLYDVFIKKNLI